MQRCHARKETGMRLLGLPLSSLLVLIVIPFVIIAYQYFVCWQIKTGRRD